jgi:hypothetical protein
MSVPNAMNHTEYAERIRARLCQPPVALPRIDIDETRGKNTARCMTALVCNRLAGHDEQPRRVQQSVYHWDGGVFAVRNARITDHHWSTAWTSSVQQLHEIAQERPVVHPLTYWAIDDGVLHAWAVPEDIAFDAFGRLPTNPRWSESKTVEVWPEDHKLKNAPFAPSFEPYYVRAEIAEAETAKLLEAIKTDGNLKQERAAAVKESTGEETGEVRGTTAPAGEEQDEFDSEAKPFYSAQTVEFLLELPNHVNDKAWHERNRRRYERVLRDPSQAIVDELREKYIRPLSPIVAGGKRHLSMLKKNDYGKGGYHDHYWYAFYDPAAGSKTRSVQLYVRFLAAEQIWRYGMSMGDYCDPYMERLYNAIMSGRQSVADYLHHAPPGTIFRLGVRDSTDQFSPSAFADRLANSEAEILPSGTAPNDIEIIREYPLETLPDHAEGLVDEIGEYFTWAWPFFDAAMSGRWSGPSRSGTISKPDIEVAVDVDEDVPQTLQELAELTALPTDFLEELEDALWAKQQAILVGPPGTSKTYIARQFARYFVRQRQGRPQGSFDVLYMHSSWSYEDFFEGLRPTSKDGSLTFEPRKGYFLEWVERLKDESANAVHVLVLDEINRCDTAAVLGELLQLLEYRGTTVRLMSGRSFVFPSNLYIIGTMNSADRSIGRLDLALRRRFFWLDLHPQPETLNRWLQRPGNNPLGFEHTSLVRCNKLLEAHGIPPEQQIGHALFMLQRIGRDDEASPSLDVPLNERKLRQIIRFSVLPYVRELLTMQFGQPDEELLRQIGEVLLQCVNNRAVAPAEPIDGEPRA